MVRPRLLLRLMDVVMILWIVFGVTLWFPLYVVGCRGLRTLCRVVSLACRIMGMFVLPIWCALTRTLILCRDWVRRLGR